MRFRRLLLVLTAVVSAGAGVLIMPTPALAIPPGGWCFDDWYETTANYGVSQQPYISKYFNNDTASTARWTESVSVTFTFQSTYTSTRTFSGGLNIGIIKAETQSVTTVTTVYTVTVNKTTSFSVDVPPYTTYYADYGPDVQRTSGTYSQSKYGCDNHDFETVTTGSVTTAGLTGAEGWRLHL